MVPPAVRRLINQGFFVKLFVGGDGGVERATRAELFAALLAEVGGGGDCRVAERGVRQCGGRGSTGYLGRAVCRPWGSGRRAAFGGVRTYVR
ncbi:hypothetical protein FMEAI12_4260005 [Parafrankia sp. Ea1.12]|nr:hypothetical protein FMEAI12_4260005 [Parafrankia sp. Ea1.12]